MTTNKPQNPANIGSTIWHDQKRMFPPMAVGLSMAGFYVTAAGSLIATLSRDLGVKPEALNWLGAAYGFGMLVSGLLAPWVMRNGPVWSLRLAPLLVLLGTALVAWSPSIAVSLVGVTLACLGGTTVSAAVAGTFVGTEGTKYMSLTVGISSSVSIATTVLFALVERVFPGFGRMALWFVLVMALPTLVWGWRLPAVPLRKLFQKGLSDAAASPDAVGEPDSGDSAPTAREANLEENPKKPSTPSVKPSKWLLISQILRLSLTAGVEFAMYAWAVTRLRELGVELALASGLATAFAIGMAMGRLGGAVFARYYWAWWVFVGLGCFGTAAVAFVPSVGVAVVGLFISGVGVSCLYPISATEFSGLPGVRKEYAAAVISSLSGIGAIVTPLLLGLLLAAVGLHYGFLVLLGFYVLMVFLPRPSASHLGIG
ncbi:sugar MFS transporter [uncultured Mobiluncus sp.]|uniref:MFS transporter n=1 Tax=uncultured Mobiluncus sp. TaxID=293425 RepID=UPI002632245B|nr:MFS transporter [uncultured Mobiluncus sp.]